MDKQPLQQGLFAMLCNKNKYPLNLILLFAFTVAMGWNVGFLCTAVAANGMAVIVVEAFAITSMIFVGLTIFTVVSGIDFSVLGMVLPMPKKASARYGSRSLRKRSSYGFFEAQAGVHW